MSAPSAPRRGELWIADFDPVIGHEHGGLRPAFVLSNDPFNIGPRRLVALMPLTSNVRGWPLHVPIAPPEGGLRHRSVIMCEQLRFLSQFRLHRPLGMVEPPTLRAVESILRRLLGI
jgi:mRNA interferase MazF